MTNGKCGEWITTEVGCEDAARELGLLDTKLQWGASNELHRPPHCYYKHETSDDAKLWFNTAFSSNASCSKERNCLCCNEESCPCLAVDGPGKGNRCMFPFIVEGKGWFLAYLYYVQYIDNVAFSWHTDASCPGNHYWPPLGVAPVAPLGATGANLSPVPKVVNNGIALDLYWPPLTKVPQRWLKVF